MIRAIRREWRAMTPADHADLRARLRLLAGAAAAVAGLLLALRIAALIAQ